MNLSKQTSELLKEIRTKKGVNLEKLSRQLKIDCQFLSNVEENKISITLDTLDKLLIALNVDSKDFLLRLSKMM